MASIYKVKANGITSKKVYTAVGALNLVEKITQKKGVPAEMILFRANASYDPDEVDADGSIGFFR